VPTTTAVRRARVTLTPAEWRRAGALAAVVAGLHAAGFFILLAFAGPRGALTIGVGVTAYTLGLRHAFDADHIAAIDNTTRKLSGEGKRPLSVGFFFSLGHSSVVFVLAVLLAAGVRALAGQVENGSSALHSTTGLIGTLVSGCFLSLIGLLNLAGLTNLVRAIRSGRWEDALQGPTGPMTRLTARFGRAIRAPWQMYPLGVLFGLGFDTATEVALLFLAAGASFAGLPFYAVLCLPILFAAGMSLLDTLDGAFMAFAYGWAFDRPVRKLYYNLTITGLSVAVALVVGVIELLSVLHDRLGLDGGFWGWISGFDLSRVGYLVVALFALTWLVALAVWRLGRIEERWGGA
jgi:nickel/cobalt transporter (NiCoT) family protein